MTVAEYVEKLRELPQDAIVWLLDEYGNVASAKGPRGQVPGSWRSTADTPPMVLLE